MAMLSSNAQNILITGGTFNNVAQGSGRAGLYFTSEGLQGMDLLADCIAPGAFHNASERYDPPKCHPSTRVAILQYIMAWIYDLQKLSFFMWLYGPAGAGKSAVAQSIAELCHEANILAATFFFSRTAVGRNDESRFIPTLVYQLCLFMPFIRKYVEAVIEEDPFVLSRSLEAQIRGLVVEPLRRALYWEKDPMPGPRLIIIDGLDECGTGKVQHYILTVLATAIQEIPPGISISFLIVSRPEQIVRAAFHAEPLGSMTRFLALDDSYRPDDDIKLFFQSKFDEIKQNHPLRELLPPGWPSNSDLLRLVQKSSGQFIYASAAMKYLDSPHQRPTDGLDIIFGLSDPGVDTPFAQLDVLYTHIFSTVKNINKALELTGFLLLSQANMLLTPKLLESLFMLRPGDVYIILSDLHAIMNIPAPSTDNTSDVIHIFHASLGDFLFDKSRSDKFYIDPGNAHANLMRYFLKHLSKTNLSMSREDSFFAEGLMKHCPLSPPTPELLDDLHQFDFHKFLTTFHHLGEVMKHISYVFDWFKEHSHKNSSGTNLYSHHLHSLDAYLQSQVVLFTTCSNLAQLMVTAIMLPKFLHHTLPIMRFLSMDSDFNEFAGACRPLIFPFGWSATDTHMAKYHILLTEFFGDPMRSTKFFVDGDKFATLATRFAKFLFRDAQPKDLKDRIIPEYYDNAVMIYSEATDNQYSQSAFACLPDCLLKASSNKDLAAFLQSHYIPAHIQPHNVSKVTTIAAQAYIMRCNLMERESNSGCCYVM